MSLWFSYYFALFLLCSGTRAWVTADCKRTTNASAKSNGTVNFGLFEYEAKLNWGLGDRPTRKHYPTPSSASFRRQGGVGTKILIWNTTLLPDTARGAPPPRPPGQ